MAKTSFDEMLNVSAPAVEEREERGSTSPVIYSGNRISFNDDEVAAPLARLAQGLTPEVMERVAEGGDWLVTGFDPQKVITVVPLTFSRTRIYAEGDGEERRVLCSSGDAVTGVGEPGGACQVCPMAQWTENLKTKKNNPPPCTISYSYDCYCEELGTILRIQLRRTAMNTAQLINQLIKSRGTGNFAMRLTSSQQKGPRGTYYIPVARVTELTPDMRETAAALMGFSAQAALTEGEDLPL